MERDPNLPYHLRPEVAPTYPRLFTDNPSQKTTPSGPGQNLLAPPKLRSRPIERTKSVLDVRTEVEASSQPRKDLAARGRKNTVGRTAKVDKRHDPIPVKRVPQLPLESDLVQHVPSTSSSHSSSSRGSSARGQASIVASNRVKFSEDVLVNKAASTPNDNAALENELPSRTRKGKSLNTRFGLKKKRTKNRNVDERENSDASRESSPVYPRNRKSSINSHENAGYDVIRPGIDFEIEAPQFLVQNEIAAESNPNKLKPGTDLEVAEYKHRLANGIVAGSDPNSSRSDTDNMVAAVNFAEAACENYLKAAKKVAGTLTALDYKRKAAQCMFAASSCTARIAMGVLTDEIDQDLAYSRAQKYSERSAFFNYQGNALLVECKTELDELSRVPTKAANAHS